MSIPKYPEVVLLERRPEIFSVKEAVATEKLHGSNFRIHFPLGMETIQDVRFGSRDTEDTEPAFPLNNMKRWFVERPDLLVAMWEVIKSYTFSDATIFGEAYGPGIQAKGVKYSNDQGILFRAFDIMVGNSFLTYDLFTEVVDKMGLKRVHEVWRGEPTRANLEGLLEKPSTEGLLNGITDPNNLAEGVVVRSNPLLRNVFGDFLIVKCKARRFSEVAHAPVEKKPREVMPVDNFVLTYVTEGRARNAIGRLLDRGVALKRNMTDMPVMINEIIADLHKECGSELQATGVPEKQLFGAVSRVLGPIYRGLLTEG
jgi:Rnl2 family RNA ligase